MAYYFADRSLAGLGDAFFPEPQIGIDSLDLHRHGDLVPLFSRFQPCITDPEIRADLQNHGALRLR